MFVIQFALLEIYITHKIIQTVETNKYLKKKIRMIDCVWFHNHTSIKSGYGFAHPALSNLRKQCQIVQTSLSVNGNNSSVTKVIIPPGAKIFSTCSSGTRDCGLQFRRMCRSGIYPVALLRSERFYRMSKHACNIPGKKPKCIASVNCADFYET